MPPCKKLQVLSLLAQVDRFMCISSIKRIKPPAQREAKFRESDIPSSISKLLCYDMVTLNLFKQSRLSSSKGIRVLSKTDERRSHTR